MDRLVTTMYPDGTYISNVYNTAGYPVRVRDRMGRWTVNTYDSAGHLLRIDYPNGDWVQKEYCGNLVTRVIDARHNTTDYFYCHEQLTGVRFPDGSTRAAGFDNFNRQIWAVDERGVAVTNTYDKLDRLVFSQYLPANQLGATKNTPAAPPAGFTYPATTNSLIYGGFENQWLSNAYDRVGNLICTKDWAALITNAYDALNRCIYQYTLYPSPYFVSAQLYTYDLLGNRLSMTTMTPYNMFVNNYCYDELDRLSWLAHDGLKQISATNVYNLNGKLASVTAKEGNDTRGARTLSYDSEQRLSGIIASYNNAQKLALSYAYNNAQQIVSIGENIDGESHTYAFAYDQRDQLTNETVSGLATVYGYDKAQNRVMKKSGTGGAPDAYSFSFASKLTNIYADVQNANHRYFYDLAGNLVTSIVSGITNLYFYNAQNKLAEVSVRGAGGLYARYFYFYDSQHRRVRITSYTPQADARYILHDGTLPMAETDNSGYVRRTFVRGVGIAEGTGDVIAEIIGTDGGTAKAVFYLSNHRGDTLAAYRGGSSGTLVATYRYDAFGNHRTNYCLVVEPENTPRYTFSTKEYLPDAKLYLYQYRVYDPIAGRWTQRDPIDYQDSINLYQFCGNNPVNSWDPHGMWTWTWSHTKYLATGIGSALGGAGLVAAGAGGTFGTAGLGAGVGAIAVVAGYGFCAVGLGTVAATVASAVNDQRPVDVGLPGSPGEFVSSAIQYAAQAALLGETPPASVKTAADGIGLAIDLSLPSGALPKAAEAVGHVASSIGAIVDNTEAHKQELRKRGEQAKRSN